MATQSKSTLEERFWRKVAKGSDAECWEWTAARIAKKGRRWHGVINRCDGTGNSLAHRVSYEIHRGAIPGGMIVHHECENPGCVNPAHLRLVTLEEHILLATGNERINAFHAGTCTRGHRVEGSNAIPYFFKGKHRVRCRICNNERQRRNAKLRRARAKA